VLRAGGLARSRRDGKIVFYALTYTGRKLLDAHLDASATTA
jgi:DNA-binding transcriptional ArsR family regulator